MTYSILHLSRNNQRTHLMVDDVTTLPVMFVTIYGMNELSKKHLGTQENILTCLESGVTTRFSSHNEAMCKQVAVVLNSRSGLFNITRATKKRCVSGAVVTGASRRNTSFPLGSILLDNCSLRLFLHQFLWNQRFPVDIFYQSYLPMIF